MRKFGILGHPLGHSLSPQIHTALFALDGETVDYQMYDIAPEELHDKFDFLSTLDGFNITIPHKVSIIDFCDRLDARSLRVSLVLNLLAMLCLLALGCMDSSNVPGDDAYRNIGGAE